MMTKLLTFCFLILCCNAQEDYPDDYGSSEVITQDNLTPDHKLENVEFLNGGEHLGNEIWPWVMAIYEKDEHGLSFICGGALITSRHVLSAGFCFKKNFNTPEKFVLFLRKYDLKAWVKSDDIEAKSVEKIFMADQYLINEYNDGDLAILQMKHPTDKTFLINQYVNIDDLDYFNNVNKYGTVYGWGETKTDIVSQTSLRVTIPIQDQQTCKDNHPQFKHLFTNNTFCVGSEKDDSGRSEHMRWHPHCPFMQNRAVGNIRLGDENLAGAVEVDGALLRHRRNVTEVATSHAEQYGVMLSITPRHPEYTSLPSRLETYSMWPQSMQQRPEQLAESGFFYTGKGDRLICHQCGGGLKDWGPTDVPWVEHAVWFPRCAYLIMKKGREFVSHVQALKNEQRRNTNLQTSVLSSISPHLPTVTATASLGHNTVNETSASGTVSPSSTASSNVSASNAAVSNEGPAVEVADMRMCKVCMQQQLGIVFLPCGHMATCPDCAPQLTSCPICRARVNAYVRAFLP